MSREQNFPFELEISFYVQFQFGVFVLQILLHQRPFCSHSGMSVYWPYSVVIRLVLYLKKSAEMNAAYNTMFLITVAITLLLVCIFYTLLIVQTVIV